MAEQRNSTSTFAFPFLCFYMDGTSCHYYYYYYLLGAAEGSAQFGVLQISSCDFEKD